MNLNLSLDWEPKILIEGRNLIRILKITNPGNRVLILSILKSKKGSLALNLTM